MAVAPVRVRPGGTGVRSTHSVERGQPQWNRDAVTVVRMLDEADHQAAYNGRAGIDDQWHVSLM